MQKVQKTREIFEVKSPKNAGDFEVKSQMPVEANRFDRHVFVKHRNSSIEWKKHVLIKNALFDIISSSKESSLF